MISSTPHIVTAAMTPGLMLLFFEWTDEVLLDDEIDEDGKARLWDGLGETIFAVVKVVSVL